MATHRFGMALTFALVVSAGITAQEINPAGETTPHARPRCCGTWTKRAVVGPAPRREHAMVYDTKRAVVFLFGGVDKSGKKPFDDSWTWNGSAWTQAKVSVHARPLPRSSHALAYDPERDRVVLFGGSTSTKPANDTWLYDAEKETWTRVKIAPAAAPPARSGHSMVWDSTRNKVLLFGGLGSDNKALNDLWAWNGEQWSPVKVPKPHPPARWGAGFAFDSSRNVAVLYGGTSSTTTLFNDTWEWNNKSWVKATTPASPGSLTATALAYDAGCRKTILFGGRVKSGAVRGETWAWDGESWGRIGNSGPASRAASGLAYDVERARVVLFAGGAQTPSNFADTWERGCAPCREENALLDDEGNVIVPADAEEETYEETSSITGDVDSIYGGQFDTSTDTWYPAIEEASNCDVSVGGTLPPLPDLKNDLAAEGIDATPEEIIESLNGWEQQIAAKAALEEMKLPKAKPVTIGDYTPPLQPACKKKGCPYVFGGRDIIFVHGFQIQHIFDSMLGVDGARSLWKPPTSSPADGDNPEFYGQGYFKKIAEEKWKKHIDRFLAGRGMKNRYLIVAYPCAERMDVAVQAVLTQIADAMRFGTGVVDPSGQNNTQGFGTPSFVIVSHSGGPPVVDVAMRAAQKHPNLKAEFIPTFAKGHIALAGAYGGSRIATAAMVMAGYISTQAPKWVCPLVRLGLAFMNDVEKPSQVSCPMLFSTFADSILLDYVPLVLRTRWGQYIDDTPVRTVTIVGGHPSLLAPLKHVIMPGFDDGVATINSQVANPNSVLLEPSGFIPRGPLGKLRVIDMGIPLVRRIGYLLDQSSDPRLNPLVNIPHPRLVAGAATPYVSPTGMVQPVAGEFLMTGGYNPLRRYELHYSYLQSASDHAKGYNGAFGGFNGIWYRDTFGERNHEETRVITDSGIYQNYAMFYPNDDQPLVQFNERPKLVEEEIKKTVRFRKKGRRFTVWRRLYHRLDGWQNKVVLDYVYDTVLTQSGMPFCPPPGPADDCNQNGIHDECDIANGTSKDCNRDGRPDECQIIDKTAPTITLQPVAQVFAPGGTLTLTVAATHVNPIEYQWRKNGIPLTENNRISGVKTATLTITPTVASDAGVYDVVVVNVCGASIASDPANVAARRPCLEPPGGMVAWYPFDEGNSTIAVDRAKANHGTRIGGPVAQTGTVAGALAFNGSSAYVQAPDRPWLHFATDFSIDFWIRVERQQASGVFVVLDKRATSPWRGYSIALVNGQPLLQIANGAGIFGFNAGFGIADGRWHLLAVTVDRDHPSGVRWYLDGIPRGVTGNPTVVQGSLATPSTLRIGRRSTTEPPGFFRGGLDEVELFDRVLSADEIAALFAASAGGKCKGALP